LAVVFPQVALKSVLVSEALVAAEMGTTNAALVDLIVMAAKAMGRIEGFAAAYVAALKVSDVKVVVIDVFLQVLFRLKCLAAIFMVTGKRPLGRVDL